MTETTIRGHDSWSNSRLRFIFGSLNSPTLDTPLDKEVSLKRTCACVPVLPITNSMSLGGDNEENVVSVFSKRSVSFEERKELF